MNGSAAILLFVVLAIVLLAACSASLYWAGGRGSGAPRGQALALALAVPLLVAGLYAWRGTPQALNPPPASSSAAGMPDPAVMVQRLADHLKQHPDDLDGWALLARSYVVMGRYPEAEDAYEHAQTKVMQDRDLLVDWIELRVMLAGRKFDARTLELVDHAATLAPDDPEVLLLRALAAYDRGDKPAAEALVAKLHERYPPGTPDRQSLDEAIAKWLQPSTPAGKP